MATLSLDLLRVKNTEHFVYKDAEDSAFDHCLAWPAPSCESSIVFTSSSSPINGVEGVVCSIVVFSVRKEFISNE